MIESYEFGSMTVDGETYKKDLKIIAGKSNPGWWRKEGHQVDIDDVEDILDARPDVFVIGTGAQGLMQVSDSLRSSLKENHIQLIAQPTEQAARIYNRLIEEGKNTAAAFHLTC